MPSPSNRSVTSRRIVFAAGGVCGVGLILLLYGMFADPFSIPFQDFDLMPAAQQTEYIAQAARAQVVRRIGMVLVAVGLLIGTFVLGRRLRRRSH